MNKKPKKSPTKIWLTKDSIDMIEKWKGTTISCSLKYFPEGIGFVSTKWVNKEIKAWRLAAETWKKTYTDLVDAIDKRNRK